MIPQMQKKSLTCLTFITILFVSIPNTFGLSATTLGPSSNIERLLKYHRIIPDVLDVAPPYDLKIIYKHLGVNFGSIFSPHYVHDKPTDIDWPVKPLSYYTLILTDPDAPSHKTPYNREWQHWVVGNIPETRIKLGETLTEYIGAIHPKGTGLHRYVFTVYQQPKIINFTEAVIDSRPSDFLRANFSTVDFARRYKLGKPHAANFFVVSWGI